MAEIAPLLTERFADGGEVIMTVTGSSMYPLLRNQMDSVTLVSVSDVRLRRYDIPLYRRSDGSYILHRIVAIQGDQYLTVGDGQVQTEVVKAQQVIGLVRGVWRNGRYYSCIHPAYRSYAVLWTWLMPIRRLLLKCILRLSALRKGDSQ